MHVVVTGASSGIGRALAALYGRRGERVTLLARRKALLEEVSAPFAERAHVVVRDLSRLEGATDWLDEAEERQGPIDVMINNAGMQIVDRAVELSDEDGERLFRVNFLSARRLGTEVVRRMIARGSGALVNIASVAAFNWTPYMSIYCASKAALAAWSEVLAVELRSQPSVHVLTVYPGPVHTPLAEAAIESFAETDLVRRMPTGTPEELAERIDGALVARKARLVYPRIYELTRLYPALANVLTARFTPDLRHS